jgi:serine/threonine-protein kinase
VSLCAACGSDAGEIAKYCPSCGATVVRAGGGDPLLGRIIAGKFRVESLLGEGGMGMVYKATQVNLDKTIVLKVLRPSLVSDERTVQRFQREAKAASRLNHPNSIGIIDFGQSPGDGSMYIAMEYCPGHDLHHILSHEWPLEEGRITRMIAQVLSALAEAHAHGVIHRDLKPENIMVEQRRGEPDFVKVLDFGIAKIMDTTGEEGQALTRAGFVCGTPEYMSPEQARGAAIDPRSDLYAVGVILYQLITGLLPFDSESAVGFATAHLTQEVPPIRKRRPEARCSPGLERLVMRALSKDPDARPQSADDFRASLMALVPGAASDTETSGPSSGERTRVVPPAEAWSDRTPAESSTETRVSGPAPAQVSSRGRMPAARAQGATALADDTRSGVVPRTRPEATGVRNASRVAIGIAALGLVGASAFFVYEYFLNRPAPAEVLEPVGATDPVEPAANPGSSSGGSGASAVQPASPSAGTTGAAVALGTTGGAHAVGTTTGSGPELSLTAMGDPGQARVLLDRARREVASDSEAALEDLRQALQVDPNNLSVLKTYAQFSMYSSAKDAAHKQLARDINLRLRERHDATEADHRVARENLKRLGVP